MFQNPDTVNELFIVVAPFNFAVPDDNEKLQVTFL
jgi:hypothetical protein